MTSSNKPLYRSLRSIPRYRPTPPLLKGHTNLIYPPFRNVSDNRASLRGLALLVNNYAHFRSALETPFSPAPIFPQKRGKKGSKKKTISPRLVPSAWVSGSGSTPLQPTTKTKSVDGLRCGTPPPQPCATSTRPGLVQVDHIFLIYYCRGL